MAIYGKNKFLHSKINNEFELGSKNFLFQTKDETEQAYIIKGTGSQQEIETGIITAALYALGRPGEKGVSAKNMVTLEAIDNLLERVDVIMNNDTGIAVINEKETGEVSTLELKGDALVRLKVFVKDMLGKGNPESKDGGFDYHILRSGYEESVADGKLTKAEIERLGKVDNFLPNADMSIDPQTGNATIIHPGGSLKILFPKPAEEGKSR